MASKNVLLIFNKKVMYKPIIYRLSQDFDVIFNVLQAKIYPKQEGRLILELSGEQEDIDKSIRYFTDEGVTVEILADKIRRDEEKCMHCGACTGVCNTETLVIDTSTMEVKFYPEKCIACGWCTRACPVKAMSGTSIDMEL